MKEINLREFYPWYMEDVMVEVTVEVAEELLAGQRYIKASRRRIYRNKAHYSLDAEDGFSLITKSDLILRDLDLLKSINEKTKCVIQMTLTTYDEGLCKKIEPNVCTTKARFEVLKELRRIGIPTVVWLCPILPFINDTEENIKGILNYCSEAEVYGIICFGMGLTLREGSREYFFRQLDHLFPGMKEKYLQTYGMQYQIVSNKNDELMQLFHHTCEKNGIVHDNRKIFEYLSTFETKCDNVQLSLFDKDFAGKSPNGI